jgi:hypothetical protein
MPLESGKSKKAFSHNVRVEMHAGKPQKQALAIAYKEAGEKPMKHNYKGMPCMACGGVVCNLNYGHLRDQVEKERKGGDGIGKGMEGHGLGRMAKGGVVEQDDAGMAYGPDNDSAIVRGAMKPLGRYAEGGSVPAEPSSAASPSPISKDKWKMFQSGFKKALGEPEEAQAAEPKKEAMGGMYVEGGDVEKEMGDDDMLMEQCAHECMEAMKKGDKMAFKDAMMAMVHEIMEKMGKE